MADLNDPHTTVKILADSISPADNRLTTMELCYPKRIHEELLTHRVFARNARSTRAVPTIKYIEEINNGKTYIPAFTKNKKGMQGEIIEKESEEWVDALVTWNHARRLAIKATEKLAQLNIHKQDANDLLAPFIYVHTVYTASEYYKMPMGKNYTFDCPWDSLFNLRVREDAHPAFQDLSRKMRAAYKESEPIPRRQHFPYISSDREKNFTSPEICMKVSAARCARVSYAPFGESETNIEKDLELGNRLLESKHMSPFEHPAVVSEGQWGCFYGWKSYRMSL